LDACPSARICARNPRQKRAGGIHRELKPLQSRAVGVQAPLLRSNNARRQQNEEEAGDQFVRPSSPVH